MVYLVLLNLKNKKSIYKEVVLVESKLIRMFTLQYVLSNIGMKPLMVFMGLMALAEIQRGRCTSLIFIYALLS